MTTKDLFHGLIAIFYISVLSLLIAIYIVLTYAYVKTMLIITFVILFLCCAYKLALCVAKFMNYDKHYKHR